MLGELIGRERELAALAELVKEQRRLITLLGAPGVGKTHLARALIEDRASARFVPVRHVRSEAGLTAALGEALGVEHVRDLRNLDTDRLVVVDDFEHLVELRSLLVQWLEAAPGLSLIVTSRTRLGVEGEWVYEVGPLAESEAITLVQQRAREVRADSPLNELDAKAIVDRVGGWPLALEIAAAQLHVLSPKQLLERWGSALDMQRKANSPRSRSLRDALDASWSLLDPDSQKALAQTAVFDGFDFEAAEAVLDVSNVVASLAKLRDASLLRREGERFSLLPPVAEYAAEHESLMDEARERHALHFASRARGLGRVEPGFESWPICVRERGNFRRVALTGPHECAAPAMLATSTMVLVERDGAVLDRLDELTDAELPEANALRLLRARVATRDDRVEHAEMDLREVLASAGPLEAEAQLLLAIVLRKTDRRDEAETAYQTAIRLAERAQNEVIWGRALGQLASLRFELGTQVETEFLRAIEIQRRAADPRGLGVTLGNLGVLRQEQGRFDAARDAFDEALALHRQTEHRRFEGITLADIAGLAMERGAPPEAEPHYRMAIRALREVGDRVMSTLVGHALAACLAERGQFHEADELLRTRVDVPFDAALQTYRACVHVGHARAAFLMGDDAKADALVRRARESHGEESYDEARLASRILERVLTDSGRWREALVLGEDWIRIEGRQTRLTPLLLRLVTKLAEAHSRGASLERDELFRAGWPGERVLHKAATNRLQVALSKLRKAGVPLVGHALDPECLVLDARPHELVQTRT